MIMTVAELRQFVTTEETDQGLEARLQALELLIRGYTNNNFQKRPFRAVAVAVADGNRLLCAATPPFKAGDTLEISEAELNPGLVTVTAVDGQTFPCAFRSAERQLDISGGRGRKNSDHRKPIAECNLGGIRNRRICKRGRTGQKGRLGVPGRCGGLAFHLRQASEPHFAAGL